jgi:hypothetical protein
MLFFDHIALLRSALPLLFAAINMLLLRSKNQILIFKIFLTINIPVTCMVIAAAIR